LQLCKETNIIRKFLDTRFAFDDDDNEEEKQPKVINPRKRANDEVFGFDNLNSIKRPRGRLLENNKIPEKRVETNKKTTAVIGHLLDLATDKEWSELIIEDMTEAERKRLQSPRREDFSHVDYPETESMWFPSQCNGNNLNVKKESRRSDEYNDELQDSPLFESNAEMTSAECRGKKFVKQKLAKPKEPEVFKLYSMSVKEVNFLMANRRAAE
jgi:hypothetical protein